MTGHSVPTPQPAHDHGASGFCTDHGRPGVCEACGSEGYCTPDCTRDAAPDERVGTVARVLREHSGSSFFEDPDDAHRWAWRCSGCAAVLFGSSTAPKVGNVPGVQFLTVALAAHQAAAVVAALDDETARLRAEVKALRDAIVAADVTLCRVRALHVYCGAGVCSCTLPWADCETRAALDPEEPR